MSRNLVTARECLANKLRLEDKKLRELRFNLFTSRAVSNLNFSCSKQNFKSTKL